jgi:metal-dependent HD superfamily phosphatase/phosphodiesterase
MVHQEVQLILRSSIEIENSIGVPRPTRNEHGDTHARRVRRRAIPNQRLRAFHVAVGLRTILHYSRSDTIYGLQGVRSVT